VIIWTLSDIHLENSHWDLPSERPNCDVVVVAGDLIPRAERGVAWLRDRFPDSRNTDVIYVLGNHERYRADFDVTVERAREAAIGSRVHVLERDSVVIKGVEFLGCTLWTDFGLFGAETVEDAMKEAEARMNDYRLIRRHRGTRRLRASDTLAAHHLSVAFLREKCALDPDRPRVICTHHPVHADALPHSLERDLVGAAYCSDRLDLVEELQPDAWISGHVHESRDRLVGAAGGRCTRLLANPKGYGPPFNSSTHHWQNRSFDPWFTFEV
jgi:Icc-related predicted phosphoesterase